MCEGNMLKFYVTDDIFRSVTLIAGYVDFRLLKINQSSSCISFESQY
jgi:hypothetical protein